MELARRTRETPESVTLALSARAKSRAAAGHDVIDMTAGEPDFNAPICVQEAAARSARSGEVRYTPAAGTAALRARIAEYMTQTRGVPFEPAEICVCHSTKHALCGALMALVDPGDEVLLLRPAWVSYDHQIRIAGGVVVEASPRPDMGPDFEAMRGAIGPRTRGVMLNSPSNPTGYVWTRAEIERLCELSREHDLWILSDEIYRRLIYAGDADFSPVSLGGDARARTVVLDGASKAYAMTGYRIGFAAGPKAVAGGIARLHSHMTGCPNAISQAAYLAALESDPPEVGHMLREFDRRRRVLESGLTRLGLYAPSQRGAFYAFPRVAEYLDERGSAGFCEDLLEQEDLAIVQGSAFGMDAHVRLAYTLSVERIEAALERLGGFLAARG